MNSFQEMEETPTEEVPEENILKSLRRLIKTRTKLSELSRRLLEKRESQAELETYLKGIVDFVKWTSTVNIAAMLWIGSNISVIPKPSQDIAIAALTFLAISLIIAIYAAKQVLTTWGKQSILAYIGESLRIGLQIPELVLDFADDVKAIHKVAGSRRELLEFIQELKADSERLMSLAAEAPDEMEKRYIEAAEVLGDRPHFFDWITWHISTLAAGLFLYVFSQINSVLGVI